MTDQEVVKELRTELGTAWSHARMATTERDALREQIAAMLTPTADQRVVEALLVSKERRVIHLMAEVVQERTRAEVAEKERNDLDADRARLSLRAGVAEGEVCRLKRDLDGYHATIARAERAEKRCAAEELDAYRSRLRIAVMGAEANEMKKELAALRERLAEEEDINRTVDEILDWVARR